VLSPCPDFGLLVLPIKLKGAVDSPAADLHWEQDVRTLGVADHAMKHALFSVDGLS
jgi:hypothetical protein